MNKADEFSLVAKCGCHCAYTKENSDNGNQKATSGYDASFKRKNHLKSFYIAMFFLASHCYRSVKPIYKNNKHIYRLQ